MDSLLIMWIVLLLGFLCVEAATAQLVTIWFALGSLAALLSCIFGANTIVQFVLFAAVSAIALIATRPLVKKFIKKPHQPTNADRCIGRTALVTEEINNVISKGQAKIDGSVWSARSEDGSVISAGAEVTVVRIEGVKLIVK